MPGPLACARPARVRMDGDRPPAAPWAGVEGGVGGGGGLVMPYREPLNCLKAMQKPGRKNNMQNILNYAKYVD
jgi:hypothetical protein